MKTEPLTLTQFYERWFESLQWHPPSVESMDSFNADIQAAIEAPYRDRAVKTELAQLKLKASRWFHRIQKAAGK